MLDDFRIYAAENSFALDDTDALDALFRDVRVVGIGESAHWVPEYYETRFFLTRFLQERHGFGTYAMESGFSEGLALDAWVQGGNGDLDDLITDAFTYRMGKPAAMRAQLAWMRDVGMRFAGLDVPGSSADLRPALRNVADAGELLDLAGRWGSEHQLIAQRSYREMPDADRQRQTALLAEMLAQPQLPRTRHELRLAQLLDQYLQGDFAARDQAMAETVLSQVSGKVVIGAGNSHLQRVPMELPGLTVPTVGSLLAGETDYLSVAVTALTGTTPTRRPDPAAPGGVAIAEVPTPPREDSVEALVAPGTVLDLRPARGKMAGPSSLRVLDMFQDIEVLRAYDVIVVIKR